MGCTLYKNVFKIIYMKKKLEANSFECSGKNKTLIRRNTCTNFSLYIHIWNWRQDVGINNFYIWFNIHVATYMYCHKENKSRVLKSLQRQWLPISQGCLNYVVWLWFDVLKHHYSTKIRWKYRGGLQNYIVSCSYQRCIGAFPL